jgi:hypothetical protein
MKIQYWNFYIVEAKIEGSWYYRQFVYYGPPKDSFTKDLKNLKDDANVELGSINHFRFLNLECIYGDPVLNDHRANSKKYLFSRNSSVLHRLYKI